jgi:SAM-dependent methyltransferase/ketosteroid isomerase-like protein
MTSPERLVEIARTWLRAFNRRDLDALLALYDDSAVHTSPKLLVQRPETKGQVRGKQNLRAWWQASFHRLPSLQYVELTITADAHRVWMEYLRKTPGEPDLFVAEVLEVQDGKIVASRVYHGAEERPAGASPISIPLGETRDLAAARKALLAQAWDDAAAGYETYFVPRFEPWTVEAVDALARVGKKLPQGPVLVPCCGPGQELLRLAVAFPDREVIGIDLSPGMVERARMRIGGTTGIWVEEGDATALAERFSGVASGVLSCFGLQQIPEPERALEQWGRCLARGGVLAVMLWPSESRDSGPFDLVRRLVRERTELPDTSWESRLAAALGRAGLETLEDRVVVHPMEHEGPEAFFDALAGSGPLRSLARSKGATFMAELRAAFVAASPKGRIVHSPRARFLLARRPG